MAINKPTPNVLTKKGLESLQKEYKDKLKERDRINKEINLARAEGDLSENEAYHAGLLAREINEVRISEIEDILDNYIIVEENSASGLVQVGSKVKVSSAGKEKIFQIVGANESDPMENKISGESPLGSALLGKSKGEIASVEIEGNNVEYQIMDVEN